MAMLAEPKRKRKWSLNPRGKLWSNDETKIGQKLLEKMGWSKGKGLGREEQGDLEPVRLKYKNDAEGVGYEAKDDLWVAHREEFNNILGSLNGSHEPVDNSEPIPVKSLEVRSKSSKARVHYHKFTRGKDLSRYSASDMACILGKRADVVIKKEEPEEEKSDDSTSNVEHLHGITTIHRGSIQEYFASKMVAVKEKQNLTEKETQFPADDIEPDAVDREKEKRVRINEELNVVKQFFAKEKIIKKNSQEAKDLEMDDSNEDSLKKKKKKSKKQFQEESVTTEALPTNEELIENPETKKKRKIKDITVEPIVTEYEPVKTKKSKKRKTEEVVSEVVENDKEISTEPERKKKKKKAKTEEEGESEKAIRIESNEIIDANIPQKKKKKSKKDEDEPSNKKLTNGTVESTVKEERSHEMLCDTAVQNSKEDDLQQFKKKKKKSKKDLVATPCPMPNYIEETETITSKKSKNKDVDEPTQNDFVEESKKKKKKSKKSEEIVTEKYQKLENSFVEIERDTRTHKPSENEEIEMIVTEFQNGEESDAPTPKKKKKKSKKGEEETQVKKSYEDDQFDSKQITKPETNGSQNAKRLEETCSEQIVCETGVIKNDIKTDQSTSSDSNKLAILQENESRQRRKVTKMLEKADFEKFVGSNLLSIAGYGVGRRFLS